MPELTIRVGRTVSLGLGGYFSDPDGDELSYVALSSNAQVATVAISGDSVAVTGVARGSAEVTVTASDGSHSALHDFTASVQLSDREALEILYDELGGDGWTDNTNWKTGIPLDEWYGVSTSGGNRVDTLDLRDNRLIGEIPPELGDLLNIEWLDLGSNLVWHDPGANRLRGEIPPELGRLSSLRGLRLDDNFLTGEIPPELGRLSNLEFLDLGSNRLTGAIPAELGSLSNLEWLNLEYNSLTGEIPPEVGSLPNLEWLNLGRNSLTGEIPPELGSLSNLEWLNLGRNSLTGKIPPELGNLSESRIPVSRLQFAIQRPDRAGEFVEPRKAVPPEQFANRRDSGRFP
ncbi:MAG: Ig-like domain-containing protein [Gemmatimonadetes bacterium]|nr:Ig-like domain-containing protein [Gemmatimonadota bacterium]MCY3944494.1 Ig-like domain-containing protein [Gemmatimonadota bacterium]